MPCKRPSLTTGASLGNPEVIHLPGRCERKGKYISVPFLDTEDTEILSLGAIWKFVKGQGSPEIISDYGARRAIRPRCIGTARARTQC